MTRKDHELLAWAMVDCRPPAEWKPQRALWATCVRALSLRLQGDNPGFDAERFVKACEKEL